MRNLAPMLKMDVKMQARYGIYYAAVFVTMVWVLVVRTLPAQVLGTAVTFVVFGDLAIIGLVFIAGQVLFEKGERTLYVLLATPLTFAEYLTSKLVSLTGVALVVSLVTAFVTYGVGFSIPWFVLGVLPMSVISTLVGLIAVAPHASISNFIVSVPVYAFILSVPLVEYFGWVSSPLLYLSPSRGSLTLLVAAFTPLPTGSIVAALVHQAVWIVALWHLARIRFERYVAGREGGRAE